MNPFFLSPNSVHKWLTQQPPELVLDALCDDQWNALINASPPPLFDGSPWYCPIWVTTLRSQLHIALEKSPQPLLVGDALNLLEQTMQEHGYI